MVLPFWVGSGQGRLQLGASAGHLEDASELLFDLVSELTFEAIQHSQVQSSRETYVGFVYVSREKIAPAGQVHSRFG